MSLVLCPSSDPAANAARRLELVMNALALCGQRKRMREYLCLLCMHLMQATVFILAFMTGWGGLFALCAACMLAQAFFLGRLHYIARSITYYELKGTAEKMLRDLPDLSPRNDGWFQMIMGHVQYDKRVERDMAIRELEKADFLQGCAFIREAREAFL